MDKKMINLPQNYKKIIEEINNIINKNNLEKLHNDTIEFKELNLLHNKINEICKNNECNSFDINKLVHGYQKTNMTVSVLKKIAKLRNKHIVANASKEKCWKNNIDNLKIKNQDIIGKKIKSNIVEKSFIELLKKYKYDWDGLWSIIETDKNGNIKDINVFDFDENDFITDFIKNQLSN